MDLGLEDKVALVTGGSRGIGAAIALALSREGCDVAIIHHNDEERVAGVVAEVESHGRKATALDSDVASFAEAESVVDRVRTEFGRLDILVCNAGVTDDGVAWKMREAQWDNVVDVNLKGCFNYCRHVAAVFREEGRGNIVNIASINGLRGKFGQANYAASKGGVIAFSKALARDLGHHGVNVNAVAPGMVITDLTKSLPKEILLRAREESAMGRLGDVADIANAVVFLCSKPAQHITGVCLPVDGGQLG